MNEGRFNFHILKSKKQKQKPDVYAVNEKRLYYKNMYSKLLLNKLKVMWDPSL
jgi:hypothetical protein